MIYYIPRSKKNIQTGEYSYYPSIAPVTAVKLDSVADQISRECTVSMPDIKAVINALEHYIVGALKNGQSVRLGDLGSFRPTIYCAKETGVKDSKDVSSDNIVGVRCRFTAGGNLRRALQRKNVEFGPYRTPSITSDGPAEGA